jgi:spore cortex biosynthesis protein YabQ
LVSLDVQLYMLFVFVITGIALGVVFDAYRSLRRVFKIRGVLTHLLDLILWITWIFLMGWGMLFGNWGDLRLYVFVGIGIGLFIYFQLASYIFLAVFLRVFRVIRSVSTKTATQVNKVWQKQLGVARKLSGAVGDLKKKMDLAKAWKALLPKFPPNQK